MVDRAIVGTVKNYLKVLPQYGIHPTAAIIYGSCARGENTSHSDIDLLVVAPEFDRMKDRELINKMWHATAMDFRLEPIACGCTEWISDDTRPILEIARREGVTVYPD